MPSKSKMKKILPRILLYLSLLFFAWYLYKTDYLVFNDVSVDPLFMGLSILFLLSGFIVSALSWGNALSVHQIRIPQKTALISHGLPVFAKYIPGKIWVILGRASYVSRKGIPLKLTSLISLKEQLIYLLLGLLICCIPVFLFTGNKWFGIAILLSALVLGLVIFSPFLHRFTLKTVEKILKKQIDLPLLRLTDAVKISYYIIIYWTLWMIAFSLLLYSVFPAQTNWSMAFAFPAGVTYGVLAIFLPGGIGVREGIFTAYLTASGMPIENAATISMISRLWFIAGEMGIFLIALTLKITGKGVDYPEYPST